MKRGAFVGQIGALLEDAGLAHAELGSAPHVKASSRAAIFLLALKVQGFGAITISGSILESQILQAAFCKDRSEKLVAWITIGTPAEGVAFEPEARNAPISVWS